MSVTTDITLLYGNLDDGELDNFNTRLEKFGVAFTSNIPPFRSMGRSLRELPGAKYYTSMVAAACWNHASDEIGVLVKVFQSFDWGAPENAILVIAREQDESVVFRPIAYMGN